MSLTTIRLGRFNKVVNAAIAAQLSPEQLTKFNALLKQQRQRESQDGPPGPPPDGGGPDGGGPGGPGGGGPPMM